MTFLPGLLQLPAFTEARAQADRRTDAEHYDPVRALEARAARQRVLRRPGGPTYAVLLDELAIRRHAAPPNVVTAQLRHLAELIETNPRVELRVLPIDAEIFGHASPPPHCDALKCVGLVELWLHQVRTLQLAMVAVAVVR